MPKHTVKCGGVFASHSHAKGLGRKIGVWVGGRPSARQGIARDCSANRLTFVGSLFHIATFTRITKCNRTVLTDKRPSDFSISLLKLEDHWPLKSFVTLDYHALHAGNHVVNIRVVKILAVSAAGPGA